MYNNNSTVALYLDEGSRYLTVSSNVVQDAGVWAFTNANANNNTDNNTFSGNWYNGGATEVATGSPHNNVLSGNVQVSGYQLAIGRAAGHQPGRHPELGGRRVPVRLSPARYRQRQPVPGRVREHHRQRRGDRPVDLQRPVQPAVPVRARLRRLRRAAGARIPAMTWRWPATPPPPGTPDIVQQPRQRRGRQPVAAHAAVRRLLAVQEPEQRPVPGRLRRRQQHRPATRPVAMQERPRHQPGLHPQLITRAFRRGGHHRPF